MSNFTRLYNICKLRALRRSETVNPKHPNTLPYTSESHTFVRTDVREISEGTLRGGGLTEAVWFNKS